MRSIFSSVLLALMFGCSHTADELSWPAYQEWLLENNEHLSKEKHINQFTIKADYLPADLLAYQEYQESVDKNSHPHLFDSLRKEYLCGLSFRLSIVSDNQGENLMYYGISSMEAYKQRVNQLNFHNEEFISLRVAGEKYKPVLSLFEGYNELSNKLTFNMVFTPKEFDCGTFDKKTEELTLTFDDPCWGTGLNHFLFKKTDLESIPKLIKAN